MRYLLHDVLTETVKLFPEKIALVQEDSTVYTYGELNSLANQFAHCLKQHKPCIRTKPFVGILSTVHCHSIAAIIGALKIGCSYVPLDDASPVERLVKIIQNTQLDIICVDPHFYHSHRALFDEPSLKKIILLGNDPGEDNVKIIKYDDLCQFPKEDPENFTQVSDDLAYILHSSGSTGVPKGIMLTHRNARTFIDWMHKEFVISREDIIMSRAPFKFDLSIFDVFNTFKAGAKLVCFDWHKERKSDQKHKAYVALMEREQATILYTTPSTLITLMNRGDLRESSLALSRVMYAGEPFPVPQLRKFKDILPHARIANIYGPTETNIITYYWINDIPETMTSIPLGHIVEDTEIIVVSEDKMRLCEINEIGELWCRGGTVTLGYLGMPEKTKECLVQSPFHPYPASFWRTGDFGYLDEQGLLHYCGRRDHMIKVKGFRIEIGEVESALARIEGLDEFCTVGIPHPEFGNTLIAFYSEQNDRDIKPAMVRVDLEERLPSYMVPDKIIKLKTLPKTSSGKIDRIFLTDNFIN